MRILFILLLAVALTPEALAQWSSGRPDGHAPIGVMGDHAHGAGEFMVSYRFMPMAMAGLRDGTDSVEPDDVTRADGYGYMVSPVDMDMTMTMVMGEQEMPMDTSAKVKTRMYPKAVTATEEAPTEK